MKHVHYDKIVAKAANMELVVFLENNQGWSEKENQSDIQFHEQFDYFLCLPKHKEACLHYLNGGDVLVKSNLVPSWATVTHGQLWGKAIGWMREDAQYRIKPKKEKRWIAVDPSHKQMSTKLFESEDALWSYFGGCAGNASGYQFIEIEVEV